MSRKTDGGQTFEKGKEPLLGPVPITHGVIQRAAVMGLHMISSTEPHKISEATVTIET
jgi:hypothetical protein